VWFSLFATSMGLNAFLPELSVYAIERFQLTDPADKTFWGGLIYGAAPLCAAFAGPVWGALGDRRGKRPMAVRANFAIALVTLLMPFAPSPGWLTLLRALMGALAGYVAPAMALVSEQTPQERQGRALASMQVAMAMGTLIGPLLGWAAIQCVLALRPADAPQWWGRASLFWITSVLAATAGVLLWRFVAESHGAAARPQSFLRELLQSSGSLLRRPVFAWLLVLVLGLRLGQNMLEPFVALFVRQVGPLPLFASWVGHVGPDDYERACSLTSNLAFSMLALASIVFTPAWGRLGDRSGPLRCLGTIGLLLGAIQVGTSFIGGIHGYLLLRCAGAVVMAGSMTLAYAAAGRRVPVERRTLAFSMVQSCMQLAFGCGPGLGHLIARIGAVDQPNFRIAFVASGALCALAGIAMFVLRRWSVGRPETVAAPVTPVA